jgi:hypothetical protein
MRSFIAAIAVVLSTISPGFVIASAKAEPSPGANVVLWMTNEDGPVFGAQSYDPTTGSWVDCHYCGAVVPHSFNSVDMRKPYVTVKHGNKNDKVVSVSYVYQAWNQQGWVEGSEPVIRHKLPANGKLKLFIGSNGAVKMLRGVTVDLHNSHKSMMDSNFKGGEPCEPTAPVFDCGNTK